jgi:tol-pal system protein YbgF
MKKAFLLTTCALVGFANFANAQTDAAMAKLNRIEKRMIAIEKQVYSGKAGVATGVTADNKLLAQTQVKVDNMQEQNAKLYGKIEELSYAVEKLAEQVKLMSEDFDYRLNELEKMAENNSTEAPTTTDANAPATKPVEPVVAKTQTAKRVRSEVPEMLAPEKLYQKAYNYLTSANYDKSTDWFEAFIERFPEHQYADNSYYWLGELALVQGDPKNALLHFSKGLKKFPNGTKASANLLKIGVAFKQMGNLKHAKTSWDKLISDYPNTPEAKKAQNFLAELDKTN